jgi:hypothetical protein
VSGDAKDKGLARFIGITGHGVKAPQRHLETLERYPFDSVLAPCNYLLLHMPEYADSFMRLREYCYERGIPLQTIKSVARRRYPGQKWTHATWYEPLSDPEAIGKAVTWVLGLPEVFLVTAGELAVLPHMLSAAAQFEGQPSDEAMRNMVADREMKPIFT